MKFDLPLAPLSSGGQDAVHCHTELSSHDGSLAADLGEFPMFYKELAFQVGVLLLGCIGEACALPCGFRQARLALCLKRGWASPVRRGLASSRVLV